MTAWEQLVTALSALSGVALTVSVVCHGLLWRVVRRHHARGAVAERVTVLKPLCGVDAGLRENLEGFAAQTHENLQLVLGVANPNDGALRVAQEFCRDNPQLDTTLSIGEASIINPKVALLERMSRLARGTWLVVSDSNVRIGPQYIEQALSQVADDVGLVTHFVVGGGGRSLAAHFENLQLNCFVTPGVCGARFLAGRTCVIGKSMFLRRDALDAVGGFRAVGSFLAEDYAMGQAIERAGYRVVTANEPVMAWHGEWTLGRFFNRHLRWAVMRRTISVPAYLAEVFLTPGPLLTTLALLASATDVLVLSPGWLLLGLLLSQSLVAVTYSRMLGRRAPWVALLVNPLREWLTLAIWVAGWFVHQIEWRGSRYRVSQHSALRVENAPLPRSLIDET